MVIVVIVVVVVVVVYFINICIIHHRLLRPPPGESKQPWLCEKGDQKKFVSFFKMLVYVPICDYGSLQCPPSTLEPCPAGIV